MLLGGADAWTGGGGPAAELRAGASVDRGPVEAAASGALEVVDDAGAGALLDQLRGSVSWRPRGGIAPCAALAVGGAVGTGWLDAVAQAGAEARIGAWRARVVGGAGALAAGSAWGPEGLASARLDGHAGWLRTSTTGSARVLGDPLPRLALDAGEWLGVGDRWRAEVGALLSAVPASAAAAVPGLPAPGTSVLQGVVAGAGSLGERWTLRLEVGPETAWGTLPYQRLRVLFGLHADLGREGPTPPEPVVGGRTRFELRAPGADRVELLGDFSDWRPLPMTRDGSAWSVEVDVPPGSWQFVYRVDGAVVVPPRAGRYVPDGFGGTNGVVVVGSR